MLWKNCQDVDSQMLASTYAYCSENLSDLRDGEKKKQKRKKRIEKESKWGKKKRQEGRPV